MFVASVAALFWLFGPRPTAAFLPGLSGTRTPTPGRLVATTLGATAAGGVGDKPTVVCHGEILFDCIANPEAAGWDLSRVVENEEWTPYPGGAPANVACALTKLGVPAAFAGAVGLDDHGKQLVDVLTNSGVQTEITTRINGLPTRTVMVTRDNEGERTFAGFGGGKASNTFADCEHRASDSKDAIIKQLRPGGWLVQGTLGLAYPSSMDSHYRMAEWAEEAGVRRFLDINWRPVFWELAEAGQGEDEGGYEDLARERIRKLARTADVIKITDEEATWLCGVPGEEALRDPSCLESQFPAAKAILITAGANGASYVIGEHNGFIPAFSNVRAVETTGAGDAFSAGFILCAMDFLDESSSASDGERSLREMSEREAREAVRFASAVGALTCTGDGAIPPQPDKEAVLRLLEDVHAGACSGASA